MPLQEPVTRLTAMAKGRVQVRRIYEDEKPDDGRRVLVDRVWPRGMSKDRADLTE